MQCPHCAVRIDKSRGQTVTCGKSECQEAEFKANQARNKPTRKLKPKVGAKKADGSAWVEVPGGIRVLEVPVPSPTSNEFKFASLLRGLVYVTDVWSAITEDLMLVSLSSGLQIEEIEELFNRAITVVNRVKKANT